MNQKYPMKKAEFSLRFPGSEAGIKTQAEEYCIIEQHGHERRIRLHDYRKIYAIPGLYEELFCKRLNYRSPDVVTRLLIEQLRQALIPVSELAVFDMGAGNGIVAEILRQRGAPLIVGIDIFPEAAEAAQRDRPGVYDHYYIEDLQNLSSGTRKKLEASGFNCLITVGALGFGDIPSPAFAEGYNFIVDGGWIAFNIKEDFLDQGDPTGFSRIVRSMVDRDILDIRVKHRYCHRITVDGRPLYYVAVIGRKKTSIPSFMS
jgi:SAM-dependent methyltransferase